jgi:hypothetical protein
MRIRHLFTQRDLSRIYGMDGTYRATFDVVKAHVRMNAQMLQMDARQRRVRYERVPPGKLCIIRDAMLDRDGTYLVGAEPCVLHCELRYPIYPRRRIRQPITPTRRGHRRNRTGSPRFSGCA